MELCHIVRGQRAFHRLADQQKNEMIRHAAMSPQERFRKIQETVSSLAICFVLFFVFNFVSQDYFDYYQLLLLYNIF